MRFGSIQFPGEGGKHRNPQGQDCPGRFFEVKEIAVGGAYINTVECMTCHRELPAVEDKLVNSPNPIAAKLAGAASQMKDATDAATGARLLAQEFTSKARAQSPQECEKLKRLLKQSADSYNAERPKGFPKFEFVPAGRLDAGKFAIQLQQDIRIDHFRLRIVIGLHPNAAQFMLEVPDIQSTVYDLRGYVDEEGFSWVGPDGRRYDNQSIVDEAMQELSNFLTADKAKSMGL